MDGWRGKKVTSEKRMLCSVRVSRLRDVKLRLKISSRSRSIKSEHGSSSASFFVGSFELTVDLIFGMVFFAICKSTKMINLFSCFVTFHKYQTDRKMCLFLSHFRICQKQILPSPSPSVSLWPYLAISIALCVSIFLCILFYFVCVGSNVKSIFILTPMWIQFSIWIYSTIHSDRSIVCCWCCCCGCCFCCCVVFFSVCWFMVASMRLPACQSACSLIRPYTRFSSLSSLPSPKCIDLNIIE